MIASGLRSSAAALLTLTRSLTCSAYHPMRHRLCTCAAAHDQMLGANPERSVGRNVRIQLVAPVLYFFWRPLGVWFVHSGRRCAEYLI